MKLFLDKKDTVVKIYTAPFFCLQFFYLSEIIWIENIILEGHSYVHSTTWHWTNEKCKFVSALPDKKDSLREKIMWIQFWCLIPSKFTSALPQTSCAVCFPQSNISQQVVPMYSCPYVPQLHLPSASSPYSLVVFETLLTKPSTWTVLHNDVEGEIQVSWFSHSSSVVSLASPMQISCPERYLKCYQTPWLGHLGHSLNLLLWQSLTASVSHPWKRKPCTSPVQDDPEWDLQVPLKNDWVASTAQGLKCVFQESLMTKCFKFNI